MCLYVVTRFLICVYLDVFNKMFYFKLCKCRYRRDNIIYYTLLKFYLIAFQKMTMYKIPTCKVLVEVYSKLIRQRRISSSFNELH